MINFFNNNEYEKRDGDIRICTYGNNNSVILPMKNRLLNTLIVGPVGSGRTSLSLLDMAYQDMQNSKYGITFMDIEGDSCMRAYAMAKYLGRKATVFNPELKTCPKFNPIQGNENDVIENLTCAFKIINKDDDNYFLDLYEISLKYSIKLLKRLYSDSASFKQLSDFINNENGYGLETLEKFESFIPQNDENKEIASWLKSRYFSNNSTTFQDNKKLQTQLKDFISDTYLKDVLTIPNKADFNCEVLDFEKSLVNGDILIISLFQSGLKDKSKLLGYLLMLQLQLAIFNRRELEPNLTPNCLYINEFDFFNNPGFLDTLITAKSYDIAIALTIQNKNSLTENFGKYGASIETYLSVIFNTIVYPGINKTEANYYADLFNESSGTTTFTADNIMYKKFGEISYKIYKDNKYECASGKVKTLPKEIHENITAIEKELHNSFSYEKKKR